MKSVAVALLLFTASAAHAQTPDASGHWKGSIEVPGQPLELDVDLARNSGGILVGAASAGNAKNIPLARVTVDGTSISFYSRSDQPFRGVLSADGKSISGNITISGYNLPLDFTRTGDARLEPPPTSPPITKDLEGTWTGTLTTGNGDRGAVLTLQNGPHGRSTGMFVSVDEGGLMLPVLISQQGAAVTLRLSGVDGTYSGTLDSAANEIAGTFTQGGASLPLTLKRAPAESTR